MLLLSYSLLVYSVQVTNAFAVLFFACVFVSLSSMSSMPYLIRSNTILQRELTAGAYQATPNWLAQICLPIVPLFLAHWLLIFPYYFLVQFPIKVEKFFYFSFVLYFFR